MGFSLGVWVDFASFFFFLFSLDDRAGFCLLGGVLCVCFVIFFLAFYYLFSLDIKCRGSTGAVAERYSG